MRGLLVGLVVALMAVPVLAAGNTATISIETPGSVYDPTGDCVTGGPANVIDCNDLQLNGSGNWYLDMYVDCSDTMSAFQLTLGSNCDDICLLAMETLMGNVLNYAGAYSNYASRPGIPDNGWAQAADLVVQPTPGCLPMGGPDPVGGNHDMLMTLNSGPMAVSGIVAWLEMLPVACIDPYCCCIYETPPITGASVGDSAFDPAAVSVIPLCITPEPASALLLLLGVPLLRRRR